MAHKPLRLRLAFNLCKQDAEAPAALPTEDRRALFLRVLPTSVSLVLRSSVAQIPKVRAAELFMELAEGDFAKRAAWEAAEKADGRMSMFRGVVGFAGALGRLCGRRSRGRCPL